MVHSWDCARARPDTAARHNTRHWSTVPFSSTPPVLMKLLQDPPTAGCTVSYYYPSPPDLFPSAQEHKIIRKVNGVSSFPNSACGLALSSLFRHHAPKNPGSTFNIVVRKDLLVIKKDNHGNSLKHCSIIKISTL